MKINNIEYVLVDGNFDEFLDDEFLSRVTDYFSVFDFIVGDWAYGKVRLKGFYSSDSKNCKDFNNIDNVKEYFSNNCAYGCKYVILKKISV